MLEADLALRTFTECHSAKWSMLLSPLKSFPTGNVMVDGIVSRIDGGVPVQVTRAAT